MGLEPSSVDDMVADLQKPEVQNGLKALIGVDPNLRYAPAIPKTVKIGHFTFTIHVDKSKLHDYERRGAKELYGKNDLDKQEIVLDPGQPTQLMRDTLWHEILHGIFWVAGLEDQMSEEQYVRTGASFELLVLRDNPELVAYLTAP